MYAVIATGGKQYRVTEGQTLKLESLSVDPGSMIEFDHVLLIVDGEDVKIGAPYLVGVKVYGEALQHGRHDKVEIIKFRRRKHHMKRQGHRQDYTEVTITGIGKPGVKRAMAAATEKKTQSATTQVAVAKKATAIKKQTVKKTAVKKKRAVTASEE